jgi:cathepsin X
MIRIPILCLLLVAALAVELDISAYRTHKPSKTFKPTVLTQIPQLQDIPKNFWWGNFNNTNFLTVQRNQHIPIYCGSSWAFSSASALSDRIKIARKAQWPDVIISPQVLISC